MGSRKNPRIFPVSDKICKVARCGPYAINQQSILQVRQTASLLFQAMAAVLPRFAGLRAFVLVRVWPLAEIGLRSLSTVAEAKLRKWLCKMGFAKISIAGTKTRYRKDRCGD